MTIETLPVVASAEAVTGEVIDPAEQLKKHERNIRQNFVKFQKVAQSVSRSLNVIYYNDLWKLHKDENGKRKYTNFDVYLTEEFGWDKTAARARQLMKQDLPLAIEAGEVPAEAGDKRRTRQAPEITAAKAAKMTAKQLDTALGAAETRMSNVEEGEGATALAVLWVSAKASIAQVINDLNDFVAEQEAEAESADEDDEDNDEDDDDSQES